MGNNQTMLYRSPGAQVAHGDLTYDCIGVDTSEEIDKLLKEGWSITMTEALGRSEKATPRDIDQMTPESRAKLATEKLSLMADAAATANTALAASEVSKKILEKELADTDAKIKAAEALWAEADAKVKAAEAIRADADAKVKAAQSDAADASLAADTRLGAVETAKKALAGAEAKKKGK